MRLIVNEIGLVSVVSQVVKLIKMRRRALFIPRALTRVKKKLLVIEVFLASNVIKTRRGM